MNNLEKAEEIASKIIAIDKPITHSTLINALIMMAQWKDEQTKQLLIEKTKLLSPSSVQDSIKRCTIEEIYRELFNEEIPNSNPYMK